MSYWNTIRIAGEDVQLMIHPASSGEFEVGAQYGNSDEDGYLALLNDEELCWHSRVSDPRSVGVSDAGAIVVADWIEYGKSTGADISVIDKTQSGVYKAHLEGSSPMVDISPDGDLIAVCPYNEPARIIDIRTDEELLRHEYDVADRLIPRWVRVDGETQLEFRQKSGADSLYRINLDGSITWTGDSFESHQYYQIVTLDETVQWNEVLEKFAQEYAQSDDAELKDIIANTIGDARLVDANPKKLFEVIDALTAVRATFANNDAHEKLVAQTLGEAYYRLAANLRGGVSIDEEFWQLIEQSAAAYQTALPWYEGKRGLAKTLRLQANQYAKQNRISEALCCYEQIESLESQYDVDLLSTGDENRLEEYRKKNLRSKEPQETGRLIQQTGLSAYEY